VCRLIRDPAVAASAPYELIVVGGGAHGAALALEAARRHLPVLLLERDDFGAATSSATHGILHGGLRYLQGLDLPRYHESVTERSWFLEHFPELCEPLPVLLVLDGSGLRRPAVFRMALALNDLLSSRRNARLSSSHRLLRGRVLSPGEVRARSPFPPAGPIAGGALWQDGRLRSPRRAIVEMLRWAVRCGAIVLNHVEAGRLLRDERGVAGVEAVDRETGDRLELRAPRVVNCAGPWCQELADRWDPARRDLFRPSLAFNLVLKRELPPSSALGFTATTPGFSTRGPEKRNLFLWSGEGWTHIGTCHLPWTQGIGVPQVGVDVVERFLSSVNESLPEAGFRLEEVVEVQCGYLPAAGPGAAATRHRDRILDHGRVGGIPGLYSVSGIKWTTARAVAERCLRTAFGGTLPGLRRDPRPESRGLLLFDEFDRLRRSDPDRAGRLAETLMAEESAGHLDDLLQRRFEGAHPREAVLDVADWISGRLGWNAGRREAELARLRGALDRKLPAAAGSRSEEEEARAARPGPAG
jgi:glycerol-3-phosphate dehydrogenase